METKKVELREDSIQRDAKYIVDTLFDAKVFKDILTRDDFNDVEGLISLLIRNQLHNHLVVDKFFEEMNSKYNKDGTE